MNDIEPAPKKRRMGPTNTMEVVNEINSIQGDSLSELLKNYHRYIIKREIYLAQNLDEILLNFNPENDIQQLFKLNLIKKFKRKKDGLEILKTGDISNIHRVLKWPWFFENVEPDEFLNNTIPHLSYMTRKKVLKKYSRYLKSTDQAEQIFDGLRTQYGLNLAYIILPACSEKFLRRNMPSFCSQIPYATLKVIYNKYPDPAIDYLEYILKGKLSGNRNLKTYDLDLYTEIFKTLVIKDSKRFIDLYDKYKLHLPLFKLGRRSTKLVLSHHKEAIIKKYPNYSQLVNLKCLITYLSITEIKQLLLSFFPKSLLKFFDSFQYSDSNKLIKLTTRIKKYNCEQMLVDTFEEVYKKKLIPEELSVPSDDIKSLLPFLPAETRKKWIELQTEKKPQFILYLPTETSIPILKKMIESENDVFKRVDIVESIMKSILFNKDANSIPLILEYFNTRFRNDQDILKASIINNLAKMDNLLIFLDFEKWKHIDNFFDILKLNKEHTSFLHELRKIYAARIKKCFQLEKPPENYLKHFMDNLCTCDEYYAYDLLQSTEYEKKCLEWFIQNFEPGDVNETQFEYKSTKMFCTICEYNSKHDDKVAMPDFLIKNIVAILNNECERSAAKRNIMDSITLELQKEIFPKINLFDLPNLSKLLNYLLKNDPNALLHRIEKIIEIIFDKRDNYNQFFKTVKLYTHFGVPQKIIEICVKFVETEDDSLGPSKAVKVLSILLPTAKFLEVMSKYYPTVNKVDDFSDHGRAIYDIQKAIAGSFKNVNNPGQAVDVIKKFAVGDYLKLVIGSINSVCLQVPQKDILPLLIEWFDSPVSARKHFIRCYDFIAPKQNKISVFTQIFKDEKNSSLRLVIFDKVLKTFLKEPVQETFEGFCSILCNLKQDEELITKMYDITLIPNDYVSKYLMVLWNLVKDGNEKVKVINLITKDVINLLENEFCDRLVDQVFILANENLNLDYLITYILYSNDSNVQNLQNVLTSLGDFIKNRYNEFKVTSSMVFPTRNIIYKFVSLFCDEIGRLENENLDTIGLLKNLKLNLNLILKEENGYGLPLEETLILDYKIMLKEKRLGNTEDETYIQHRVDFVNVMFEKYANDYGVVILNLLPNIIEYNSLETKELLKLIDMLLDNKNIWCNLLAVDIFPRNINDDTLVEQYKNVLQKMVIKENPILRESINVNLRDLESRITVH